MRYTLLLVLAGLAWSLQAQIVNPNKVRFGKFSDEEIELKPTLLTPMQRLWFFSMKEKPGWITTPPPTALSLW